MKDSEKYQKLIDEFKDDLLGWIYYKICKTYSINKYDEIFAAKKFSEYSKEYSIEYCKWINDNNIETNDVETFNKYMNDVYGQKISARNSEMLQYLEKRGS